MTTLNYVNMSLEILCVAISLIVFFSLLMDRDKRSGTRRLFRTLILCNIGLVASDVVALLTRGSAGRHAYYLVRAANFLHFAFGPLVLVSLTFYMLAYIGLNAKVPRGIKAAVLLLCALSLLLTVVSQFTGMYYVIDENNLYHRQELFWLSQVLPAAGLLMNIGILFAYRGVLKRGAALFFLTYMVLPAAALGIQIVFYGITFVNISTTLIILILYIFVQTEQARHKEMLERALSADNAALDRLNHMKSDLIANFSHEARTPLAVLASYAGLVAMEIKDKGMDGPIAADLDTIAFEAERVAGLIDGMKALSGQKEAAAKRTVLDAGEIIRQTARLYAHILERGGVTLITDIPGGLPPVFGNPEELTQVVFNLLQNAKNHTERGSVTVSAKADNGRVAVTVSDTGSGVRPELLPRIFERGVTGGKGSGLGLSICKDILESHGGTISAESDGGNGTAVTFHLPEIKEGGADGQ